MPIPTGSSSDWRAADVIEVRHGFVGALDHEVEVLHLVQDAKGSTLLTGAVVAHEQNQRVVEFAERREVLDETPDLRVGVFEERRVRLLRARREQLVVGRAGRPTASTPSLRGASSVSGGTMPIARCRANQLLAGDVPALVVAATMFAPVDRPAPGVARGSRRRPGR